MMGHVSKNLPNTEGWVRLRRVVNACTTPPAPLSLCPTGVPGMLLVGDYGPALVYDGSGTGGGWGTKTSKFVGDRNPVALCAGGLLYRHW